MAQISNKSAFKTFLLTCLNSSYLIDSRISQGNWHPLSLVPVEFNENLIPVIEDVWRISLGLTSGMALVLSYCRVWNYSLKDRLRWILELTMVYWGIPFHFIIQPPQIWLPWSPANHMKENLFKAPFEDCPPKLQLHTLTWSAPVISAAHTFSSLLTKIHYPSVLCLPSYHCQPCQYFPVRSSLSYPLLL